MAPSNEMADDTPEPAPNFGDIRPTRSDDAATADRTTVTRVLGSADPAFAPGVAAPNRAGFAASGVAAIVAHAAVFLALISAPVGKLGGSGAALDAISISIISANALQARPASTDVVARAATDEIAPSEGDDTASAKAAPDETKEAKRETLREPAEKPPVEIDKEQPATPAAPEAPALEAIPDTATAETVVPTPPEPVTEPKVAVAEPPPQPTLPDKREDPPKDDASTPSPEASTAGGAPSRGEAPDLPPAAAAASASQGDVRAYGLALQEALLAVDQREAKARVAATRAKGTVVLRLVLSSDGALERADIERSSGHRQLDEAAVLLVRRTAFPRPPASLTADQRSYIAPIVFR